MNEFQRDILEIKFWKKEQKSFNDNSKKFLNEIIKRI